MIIQGQQKWARGFKQTGKFLKYSIGCNATCSYSYKGTYIALHWWQLNSNSSVASWIGYRIQLMLLYVWLSWVWLVKQTDLNKVWKVVVKINGKLQPTLISSNFIASK